MRSSLTMKNIRGGVKYPPTFRDRRKMPLTSKTEQGIRIWSQKGKETLTKKIFPLPILLESALGEAGYQRGGVQEWVLKTHDWEHRIKLFKVPNREEVYINVGYLDTLTKEDLPYLWDVIRSHWLSRDI